MPFSGRHEHAIGCSDKAMGGAALNMGIEAMNGDTDMVTIFDDFNHIVGVEEADGATNWETLGWEITEDVGGGANANERIFMNDPAVTTSQDYSCIVLDAGDTSSSGFNMQLDHLGNTLLASGDHSFPHMWVPESDAGATCLDNTVWQFACRLGFYSDAAAGWDGKFYIGWAENADTSIFTHDALTMVEPIITQDETGPLYGFAIIPDGSIHGIAQRTVGTVYAEGVNHTLLRAAGAADNATVNTPTWYDLAFRISVLDASDDDANGQVEFFSRPVPAAAAMSPNKTHSSGGERWTRHGTILDNQAFPSNAVALSPTFELLNGPTNDSLVKLDWWTFGQSRFSRR